MDNERARSDDDRDESPEEKLDRNWDELLQELRITQTGIQLLSGFLLTLPFSDVFTDLDHAQKGLYLCLVVLAALAVGANMTPVMLHRRVFGQHVKDRVVDVAHVLSQVVIGTVAVLFTGTAALIFSVVLDWKAGIAVAACLLAALGLMLGIAPWLLERTARPRPRG